MTNVLIIDNYDSFVYNLYQYVGELGAEVSVKRNNITLKDIEKMNPDKLIISPGPGRPEDAGTSVNAIKLFSERIPILGVCLGHQAIGAAFGGEIVRAKTLLHGKTSIIDHNGMDVFNGVNNPFTATRYHSLVIDESTFPRELEVTARSQGDRAIMAVRHVARPVFGVQFHPESILTAEGKKIIKNFLEI